jgi:hypothetical protein
MGKDAACDQVPDPRDRLGVLWRLDFQSNTENLGEIASISEAA